MVQDCVRSCSRLFYVLAGCLSLACGNITTPDVQSGSEPRGNDEDDEDDRGNEQPPPSTMPNTPRMDGGRPPAQSGEVDCEGVAVAGLSVTIGSPDFECNDLTVTATAADFEEELACSVRDDRCRCFGVHERPGTYRVTVEAGDPPEELAEREVEIVMDDANCNVETATVTVRVTARDAPDGGAPDAGGGDEDPGPEVQDAGT